MNCDNRKSIFQIGEEKPIPATKNNIAPKSQMTVIRNSPLISFTDKKRKKRFHFSFRSIILPVFSLLIAYLILCSYAESKLGPQITDLAKSSANKHLLETVNEAVGQIARDGLLQYDAMVKTIRDEKGEVIYLEVDTGMLAEAKATLVSRISQALEDKKSFYLSVPLGNLTGWNLFSGMGFPLRIKLYPIEMAEGEIYTVLEDCGINQTRHLIQITVRAKLLVVLPGENTQVETEVVLPIGERVLVGEVPEIYLDTIGAGSGT